MFTHSLPRCLFISGITQGIVILDMWISSMNFKGNITASNRLTPLCSDAIGIR
jgi:hypothetical protein